MRILPFLFMAFCLVGCAQGPVALHYPLTDKQVQVVRDELRIPSLAGSPERLVPENAPVVAALNFYCRDDQTHEYYGANETWTQLNKGWALRLTEEFRKAGPPRTIGEVMPMSDVPEEGRLPVVPSGGHERKP
jgi:hypothetical protein